MSIKHRFALALSQMDMAANYKHHVVQTGNTANFVFEDGQSAAAVAEMLRIIFKRKPLIHKGGKP